MKRYNIGGVEVVAVRELKHVIRRLRRWAKDEDSTPEQKKAILSTCDDIVRQLYIDEIKAAKSEEEIAAILEMTGDFIVCKRVGKREISCFAGFDNGAKFTPNEKEALYFDYESKAEEIAETLGEGWIVCDMSPEEYEDNKRFLNVLFGNTDELSC